MVTKSMKNSNNEEKNGNFHPVENFTGIGYLISRFLAKIAKFYTSKVLNFSRFK